MTAMRRPALCASLTLALLLGLPATGVGAAPAAMASLRNVRSVPERYQGVVLRLGAGHGPLFDNVLYEGNNAAMRGKSASGAQVAQLWQRAAAVGSPIFVLRDALFSQPDHAVEQRAFSLMMPPNWVTAAAADVAAGRALKPLMAPAIDDDAAWQAIPSAAAMFGSFPASQRLYDEAHGDRKAAPSDELARIENARASVRSLAADTVDMISAAPQGPAAVARAGAERINSSDLRYFGGLGRRHVVVIAVENPSRHELEDEAKGVEIAGRNIPQKIVDLVRNTIYERRLRDGNLAIERYDLSRPAERARAIRVLQGLVPADGPKATSEVSPDGVGQIWLWVNGGLDAQGISGHDATPYVAEFRRELERSNVDTTCVHLLSKPHVRLPTGDRLRSALAAEIKRYQALDLPLSVNFDGQVMERVLREQAD